MKRLVMMALGFILALVLASPVAFAQVEQSAQASTGTSQLAAAWWQWANRQRGSGQNSREPGPVTGPGSAQLPTRSTANHWPIEPAARSARRDMADLVAGYSER